MVNESELPLTLPLLASYLPLICMSGGKYKQFDITKNGNSVFELELPFKKIIGPEY